MKKPPTKVKKNPLKKITSTQKNLIPLSQKFLEGSTPFTIEEYEELCQSLKVQAVKKKSDPHLFLQLGLLYRKASYSALARGCFSKVIEICEEDSTLKNQQKLNLQRESYLELAALEEHEMDYLAAFHHYEKSLNFGEADPEIRVKMALCCQQEGDLEGFESHMQNALILEPENPKVLASFSLLTLQKKEWGETVKTLKRLSKIQPLTGLQHYYLGVCFHHLGELFNSQENFQKALKIEKEAGSGKEIKEIEAKLLSPGEIFGQLIEKQVESRVGNEVKISCDNCHQQADEITRKVEKRKSRWILQISLHCPFCFFEFSHFETLF